MTTVLTPHPETAVRALSGVEKRLAGAAATYAALGLLAGLFYRALTHSRDVQGATTLSLTHTHLLALGMTVMLVVLVLERLFGLSGAKGWRWFEPAYHLGMIVTVGALFVRGTLEVIAEAPTSMAFSGIAGLGHILLTVAFVLLFTSLFGAASGRRPVA